MAALNEHNALPQDPLMSKNKELLQRRDRVVCAGVGRLSLHWPARQERYGLDAFEEREITAPLG